MHMSASEIKDMSLWEFTSQADGYARAHDPEAGKELSAAEADDLWQWMQTKH